MKYKRQIGIMLLCMALCCGCAAFGRVRTTGIEYVIGVSLANLSEQWRLVLKNELEEEAAQYDNVRLVILDAADNLEKQEADVERLLNFGVDLLIISPGDVEAVTPIISDVYQNIPVIVLDRIAEGFDYSLFIGPDNELIGRQAGELVLDILEEEGKKAGQVLEIKKNSMASESRSEDFLRTLSEAGIKNRSIYLAEATRDCAEDFLQLHPEMLEGIDVIFAHNDYMAYGVCLALQKLGRDDIRIVGLDGYFGENGGLKMVEEGMIDATVTCPTGGREAVRYAIDIINKKSGIPKQIILRSHKIRADNVSAYQQEKERSGQKEGTIHVGYAQIGEDSNWRDASQESILEAAKEFGIKLTVAFNAKSLEEQKAQVRQFIAEDMDVIVISPLVQEGWQDILNEAQEAQIPVLLVDRMVSVDEELYESYIGADFEEEGRRCARWMLRETADREHISIMELRGTEGSSPEQGRRHGFDEVISEDGRYSIVYSECGDFSGKDAERLVREYLTENEWDIDVIYAHNDNMALGAVEVLKEFHINPGTDVWIVSVDGTAGALEALRKGEVNCVVECNPLLGPQIMKAITDLMQGKELPLRIITDEIVFTKDTPEELFRNRKY